MAEFRYKAKDLYGRIRSGTIVSNSKAGARNKLVNMRLRPLTIKASKLDDPQNPDEGAIWGKYIYRDQNGKIQFELGDPHPTTKDLIIFTKQFATMLNSGVPLIQALGLLATQQRIRAFARAIEKIRNAVENGASLSDSLEAFPKIFDHLYISMVRAGEASGNLDVILMKLVTYIEKSAKIKAQVKSAMTYPTIVVVVALAVITGLLLFVVPTFSKQYSDAGKELPFLTQLIIDFSDFFTTYWHIGFGIIAASLIGLKQYIKTEKGTLWFDDLLLKIPGIGALLKKIAVGRFCSTMATMLSSGVNLIEALTICAASADNKIIENFVINVRSKIEQGAKFSEPLSEGDLFPQMVISMVSVGETTGALDEMLIKVSEFYDDEVDIAIKTLLSMIEPIMMVSIGGIVGLIVIAMYLPVFDMANLVGE